MTESHILGYDNHSLATVFWTRDRNPLRASCQKGYVNTYDNNKAMRYAVQWYGGFKRF